MHTQGRVAQRLHGLGQKQDSLTPAGPCTCPRAPRRQGIFVWAPTELVVSGVVVAGWFKPGSNGSIGSECVVPLTAQHSTHSPEWDSSQRGTHSLNHRARSRGSITGLDHGAQSRGSITGLNHGDQAGEPVRIHRGSQGFTGQGPKVWNLCGSTGVHWGSQGKARIPSHRFSHDDQNIKGVIYTA